MTQKKPKPRKATIQQAKRILKKRMAFCADQYKREKARGHMGEREEVQYWCGNYEGLWYAYYEIFGKALPYALEGRDVTSEKD